MRSRALVALGLFSTLTCFAPGCASEEGENSEDDSTTARLTSRFADLKKINTRNLSALAAGYATEGLNDALTKDGTGVRLGTTTVFGATDEVNSVLPAGATVKGIDKIVTGLGAKYGEKELATEVNAMRLRHLQRGADKYYLETSFDTTAAIAHGWNFDATGFRSDASPVKIGFEANAALTSRVIVASPSSSLGTLVGAPLRAAKTMRGFVMPRSAADIRAMKPGEGMALRGAGKLGANFGLGVPVLVAGGTVGYSIVASAGIAGVIGGQLDVSLLRLEGDEVAVEVGVETGKVLSFYAGLQDGFGVNGLCDDGQACLGKTKVGPVEVDLEKIVAGALEKRLNQTFQSRLQYSGSDGQGRVTISRIRFHLDRGDKAEVEKALEQTLKADIRFAQALYNKQLESRDPSVLVDFDLVRSSTTTVRDFGAALFGLSIFHRHVVEKQGEFVIQTPEGTKSVLFDTLEKRGGWFQMDHGFKRTGLSALTRDAKNPLETRGEANLFLQTVVGDSHMDDDILADNADALIASVGGVGLLAPLDQYGNAMERAIWKNCPVKEVDNGEGGTQRRTWDEKCNVGLLDPSRKVVEVDGQLLSMVDAKARGLKGFGDLLAASRLFEGHKRLLTQAAELRLTMQSVGIHNLDAVNGPNVSFALDARFDDSAVTSLSNATSASFEKALRNYMAVVALKRAESTARPDAAETSKKWDSVVAEMVRVYDRNARAIRVLGETETKRLPEALEGKTYVAHPLGIRFAIDRGESGAYQTAAVGAVSHERALAANRLFDELYDTAKAFRGGGLYAEHAATYPLLALVASDDLEVGMDVKADTRSSFWASRERFEAAGFKGVAAVSRGPSVNLISGGMFSMDALVNGN
jgi:hypothetical protein